MTQATSQSEPTAASAAIPVWRRATAALGWMVLAGLTVPVLARLTGWEAGPLAMLVALMPWMTFACLGPIALAALARSVPLAVASAAVLGLGIAWQAPLFTAADAPGEHALTVASVNLTYGGADAAEVVALVREARVDVLAAQEVTPESVAALEAAGLTALLPHGEVAAEPGVTGTALWTRMPLEDAESLPGFTGPTSRDTWVSRAVSGSVDVAGVDLHVLAVHPAAPGPLDHSGWDASMVALTEHLRQLSGPALVVGDFNTTRDHAAFRDIEALGYRDATEQAGEGLQFTFPQERRPWPLVTIDHALVRDAPLVAASTWTAAITGADHRALVIEYAHS
jgi:endonuclease/exonuclease/phosphatase (EEP) superfamily protein YafD